MGVDHNTMPFLALHSYHYNVEAIYYNFDFSFFKGNVKIYTFILREKPRYNIIWNWVEFKQTLHS